MGAADNLGIPATVGVGGRTRGIISDTVSSVTTPVEENTPGACERVRGAKGVRPITVNEVRVIGYARAMAMGIIPDGARKSIVGGRNTAAG